MGGKTAHSSHFSKSRALKKMIDLILEIKSFEKQCVILKGLLQSDKLKQHIVTIIIYQTLSNCTMYKHRYLENINKLYPFSVKCDDQLQFRSILGASMVSTHDIFTDNSPMSPGYPMIFKKCSAIKSLRLFTEVLYLKKITAVLWVVADKSNHNSIIADIMLWLSIKNRKLNTKINEQVKKYLYNWVVQHPQVVQSPISNDCLKVYIFGQSEPQLISKLLLQVSFRELHNSMMSPP